MNALCRRPIKSIISVSRALHDCAVLCHLLPQSRLRPGESGSLHRRGGTVGGAVHGRHCPSRRLVRVPNAQFIVFSVCIVILIYYAYAAVRATCKQNLTVASECQASCNCQASNRCMCSKPCSSQAAGRRCMSVSLSVSSFSILS